MLDNKTMLRYNICIFIGVKHDIEKRIVKGNEYFIWAIV